jgi:hypothetical protein
MLGFFCVCGIVTNSHFALCPPLLQLGELHEVENWVKGKKLEDLTATDMLELKRRGFSDAQLARAVGSDMMTGGRQALLTASANLQACVHVGRQLPTRAAPVRRTKRWWNPVDSVLHFLQASPPELPPSPPAVRKARKALGVEPSMKRVDTCAAEFEAGTPYMYSSYEGECECASDNNRKVLILGGGPNRIGQGIEFDYCCCHASFSLRDAGFETIMMNSNPETVSTDYDTSSRLYFEPLTVR